MKITIYAPGAELHAFAREAAQDNRVHVYPYHGCAVIQASRDAIRELMPSWLTPRIIVWFQSPGRNYRPTPPWEKY